MRLAQLLCGACLLAATPAIAQDNSLLDEILVTATRHSFRVEQATGATRTQTRIEDIPQAIQIVSREVIDEQQITRLSDAASSRSRAP